MDIRKLQRAIVDGLEDVKAQHIVVFNTEHLTPLFERVIIASGTSNRQTKALAASVREAVKSHGGPVPRMEGQVNGEWIIVDCGAAVVHIMQPGIRDYYHLEELWGDKPVKMKLDDKATGLPKASSQVQQAVVAPTPAKSPTKKTVAKKAAAKKAPARKSPLRAPAAKKGITRTVGVKKAVAAKQIVAAKKSAPTKKKPAARKTAPARRR